MVMDRVTGDLVCLGYNLLANEDLGSGHRAGQRGFGPTKTEKSIRES